MDKSPKQLYKKLDAFQTAVKERIKSEFVQLSLAGFDELNVIQARKVTQALYERIDRFARKQYRVLYGWAYEWAYVQSGRDLGKTDWTKVVDDWLKGYDPVTQYVYDRELDRKQMRLEEAILTAKEYNDRQMFDDALKTASNYLYTQIVQYGLDLTDEGEMDGFRDSGTEYVQWHTYMDGRQCSECEERDNKVYPFVEAPDIPAHYRCRCFYTRVSGDFKRISVGDR